MSDNSKFTFAVPANSFKWCEITCMVVPDIVLDVSKYCQRYPIWEINLSMVFTAADERKSYDHKVYYFCCIAERWLLGDLVGQHFALLQHPLLDKLKVKILEHYPELVSSKKSANNRSSNTPSSPSSQGNAKPSARKKPAT